MIFDSIFVLLHFPLFLQIILLSFVQNKSLEAIPSKRNLFK